MDPFTIMAIAQGAGAGVNFLSNLVNRPPKFGETAYGRRLKQLSEQGSISPTARSNILGSVGRETGNVAQQAKVGYKGRLISQGMGGSIAGQRGLAEFDVQRMDQMGTTARNIETENELSKAQYGLQYAQAATDYGQQRQAYDRNTMTGLVQGATSAIGTYAQGLQQKEAFGLQQEQARGEIANRGKYYDYLQSKVSGDKMPDVTKANIGDMLNYIHGGKTDQEFLDRQKLLFAALEKAGLLEKYMSIMGQQ